MLNSILFAVVVVLLVLFLMVRRLRKEGFFKKKKSPNECKCSCEPHLNLNATGSPGLEGSLEDAGITENVPPNSIQFPESKPLEKEAEVQASDISIMPQKKKGSRKKKR